MIINLLQERNIIMLQMPQALKVGQDSQKSCYIIYLTAGLLEQP